MEKLDLGTIRQICDCLSDKDFIAFTESSIFINRTVEADVDYLMDRCQKALNQLFIDDKSHYKIFSIVFDIKILRNLIKNIFYIRFLHLTRFPWKWFLLNVEKYAAMDTKIDIITTLYMRGPMEYVNHHLFFKQRCIVIGNILSETYFCDNIVIPYNRILYITHNSFCIGIQYADKIVGLRIDIENGITKYSKWSDSQLPKEIDPVFCIQHISEKYGRDRITMKSKIDSMLDISENSFYGLYRMHKYSQSYWADICQNKWPSVW